MQICLSSWKIVKHRFKDVCINFKLLLCSKKQKNLSCMFLLLLLFSSLSKKRNMFGVDFSGRKALEPKKRKKNVIKVIGMINFYCFWGRCLRKFNGFTNGVNRTESTTGYCFSFSFLCAIPQGGLKHAMSLPPFAV